ncbi:MAG: hypothetical protein R2911_18255 [Caldilineaceae bacterium]
MAQDALAQIDVQIPLDARVEEVSVANKQLIAISRAAPKRPPHHHGRAHQR